jgi:hypothetical protein
LSSFPVCNDNFNSSNGYIISPNYPASYPASTACTWNVTVTQGHVIILEFKAFDLVDSEGCKLDAVDVYDGEQILIGKYCGSIYPEILESSTNTLLLKFTSKAETTSYHNGFRMYYYAVTGIIRNLTL